MANTDLRSVTTSDMDNQVDKFSVDTAVLDVAGTDKTEWNNPKWHEYLGYLKTIPEFREALKALIRFSIMQGYETNNHDKVIIEGIRGWGEDSFISILGNALTIKKTNGDSYTEIIRNEKTGTLINLKPLNPGNMRTVVNEQGLIDGYKEILPNGKERLLKTNQVLHLVNDRIGNEIHGTSVLESCKWVIDARNEAMADKRRTHHRSTIRVIEVDEDDTTTLAKLQVQYEKAINKGEVLIVPKDNVSFPNTPIAYIDTQEWIRYLEGFFYVAVGVPRPIVNVEGFTEAGSKVGYMTFEPHYVEEQKLLEADLLNQLGITIKFNRPPSLSGVNQEDEAKNTGQTGFQPNEVTASATRTE